MKRAGNVLARLSFVALATMGFSTPLKVEELNCKVCFVEPYGDEHTFSPFTTFGWWNGGYKTCVGNTCHYYNVLGGCSGTHADCGGAAITAERVLLAVSGGDATRLGEALRGGERYVRYVPERQSLQLLDCAGIVTTDIPLRASLIGVALHSAELASDD